MDKILNQYHNKDTYIFALTRLFERASYYGLRGLVVLYMVGESINMSDEEALKIYGYSTVALLVTGIIGALLGDLLIGNKTTMIIGATLHMLGAFVICYPTPIALYVGLGLVVIGGGFYAPNLSSNFGRLYLTKTKLLDSAFLILYFAINIGAFIGVLAVGYLGEATSYSLGFMLAGVFMLVSLIFTILTNESNKIKGAVFKSITTPKFIKILLVFLLSGLFWVIYEFATGSMFELNKKLVEVLGLNYPPSLTSSISSFFTFPVGILLIFIWSYYYSSSIVKLAIGFVAGSIGFGLLYFIPESPTTIHFAYYVISAFFLAVAELFVSPIIYSIITKYSNPKYLAIIMSLIFLPYRVLYFGLVFLQENLIILSSTNTFAICAIAMMAISVGVVLFVFVDNDNESNNVQQLDYFKPE